MWRSPLLSVKRSLGVTLCSPWKITPKPKRLDFLAPLSSVPSGNSDTQELRVFIVAGEPSGDIIGSRLMASLRRFSPKPLQFAGVGGYVSCIHPIRPTTASLSCPFVSVMLTFSCNLFYCSLLRYFVLSHFTFRFLSCHSCPYFALRLPTSFEISIELILSSYSLSPHMYIGEDCISLFLSSVRFSVMTCLSSIFNRAVLLVLLFCFFLLDSYFYSPTFLSS